MVTLGNSSIDFPTQGLQNNLPQLVQFTSLKVLLILIQIYTSSSAEFYQGATLFCCP